MLLRLYSKSKVTIIESNSQPKSEYYQNRLAVFKEQSYDN